MADTPLMLCQTPGAASQIAALRASTPPLDKRSRRKVFDRIYLRPYLVALNG